MQIHTFYFYENRVYLPTNTKLRMRPIGVNGDAYPVAISPKVTTNLPVSFYIPTSGFKGT